MGYCLFLDDERNLSDVTWVVLPAKLSNQWVTVRNYDQFVHTVTSLGMPDFVAFDHDLADEHYVAMLRETEAARYTAFVDDDAGGLNLTFDYGSEKTGYDCAKWLVDYCDLNRIKFPSFAVHSMNPVGKQRIQQYIDSAVTHLDI